MQATHAIAAKSQTEKQLNIAISATFTIEPIEEIVSFWMQELVLSATVEFAPYNQIFQQLLDPSSLLSTNQAGINAIFLRVEDWNRFNQTVQTPDDLAKVLQRNAQDLVTALKTAVARSTIPHILCLCPAASSQPANAEPIRLFRQTESWLVKELTGINGLHLIGFQDVQNLYPVEAYYDPQRDQLGHIPFTTEFFTALGTTLARKVYAIKSRPHKVIVLDCDNTLWQGVVGEEGAIGIDISPRWQAVQEFMRAQQQAGMLLCLCSKNNEADVMQVFEHRQDMPLKLAHLVAWRINWLPKSENIKSLAAELNLGLNSFIFVDDNPVECAEVNANCPDVLTLQLPVTGDMQQFLTHVWAFDHLQVTAEDAQRTALYQQNAERQRFQQQALTMTDFLADLEMVIDIAEPAAAQLSRVAQLTQRTNQFNCTTRRRSEAEIQQLMQSGMACRVVTVRDRFGDYGLVGMMLFSTDATEDRSATGLHVDTFLLSCRVLGRGVEHHMVRHLAQYAADPAIARVNINYVATPKNRPALNFLEAIASEYQQPNTTGACFSLPVQHAAALYYTAATPQATASAPPPVAQSSPPSVQTPAVTPQPAMSQSQRLGRIALHWHTPQEIQTASQSQRQSTQTSVTPVNPSMVFPRTSTESDLSALWSELLGVYPSITDNYFELGGTSLQAVQLFAQIEQYFGKRLPLTCLLEAPTPEALAQLIDSDSDHRSPAGQPNCVLLLNSAEGITPPLFLIHPGGGDVLLYRNLAQRLNHSTAVYGIKPASQGGYPMLHTQIPEMAAYYIEQIRTIQPAGPYFLGGFCVGGVIAVEMALQLQRQGYSVPLVALMNSTDGQEAKWLARRSTTTSPVKKVAQRLKTNIKMSFYKYCVNRELPPPSFAQKMAVMSIHQAALNAYTPKARFNGELLLFKSKPDQAQPDQAQPDSSTKPQDSRANQKYLAYRIADPLLGWQQRSTQGVKLYENPGEFQGILQEPSVKAMAEQLQTYIANLSSDQHLSNSGRTDHRRIQSTGLAGVTSGR
jgi:FkbH-like protein